MRLTLPVSLGGVMIVVDGTFAVIIIVALVGFFGLRYQRRLTKVDELKIHNQAQSKELEVYREVIDMIYNDAVATDVVEAGSNLFAARTSDSIRQTFVRLNELRNQENKR